MLIKEKSPFVHAQAAAVSRPILCPGTRSRFSPSLPPSFFPSFIPQILHSFSFPSWRYTEGITQFLGRLAHRLD